MCRMPGATSADLRLLFYSLIVIFSGVFSGQAAAAPLFLDAQQARIDLSQHGEILEDLPGQWHIEDVLSDQLQRNFRPLENGDLLLNRDVKRYWLRFHLNNPSNQTIRRVLEIRPAHLGDIAVFRQPEGKATAALLTPMLPPEKLLRPQQMFRVTVPPGSQLNLFLQINTPREHRVSVQLFSDIAILQENSRHNVSNFFMLGVLSVMTAYCIIACWVYRELLFANQAIFCSLIMLSLLMGWGYLGKAHGMLPPWDGAAMLVCAIGILASEVIFALGFPIYATQRPNYWPAVLRGLLGLLFIILLIGLASAGRFSSPLFGVAAALTIAATLCAGLNGYFVSYSRLLCYYLLAKSLTLAMCLLGQLSYALGGIDIYDMNLLLTLVAAITAITNGTLLVVRSRKRWTRQHEDAQRIAVVGEVNRAKGDVLARVTHDIRTPISAILGVTELLQETRLTASQEDYLRSLQRSSHELLQLLEEAGQAVRFSENDIELSSQLISLPELVSDALSGFRNMAAEHDLELISDIANELPSQLLGDPSRVRQLLIHSMNSAFEHSDGGYILLKISSASPRPGHLQLDVSHHGSAFSSDERQALQLQKHELSDTTMNTRFAIIARLVALMQGQVSVRNSSSRNIHNLSMTIQLGAINAPREQESDSELLNNKRLLIVDSNTTFCTVVSKQCAPWGVNAFTANNEHSALAILRNQRLIHANIDYVLIDHRQSENGLLLAQRICDEFGNSADRPCIFILAHANISYSREALQKACIQRVLSKPLGNIALRSALLGESHYAARGHQIDQYSSDSLGYSSLFCLIAEDNASNALVLERMLKSLGITVQHAENGQQALNYFIRGHYDLVILDIEMPIMDGIEAARRIRQFEQEEDRERTPIFGLTANALDEQRNSYLQAGMDLHLVKPIRLWELAESIQRWTGYHHQKR